MKPKILVILGQTATGKSDLAVELARKFNGEIISADSRQVYKGLDIGSGKITKKEMRGIPHHLLDVVSPKTKFSVADFKKKAEKIIEDILKRDKLPIIVGGTAFYIDAITDGIILPEVKPNKSLRKKLEKKSTKELVEILRKLDSERLKEIDKNNPHRLIRAIEIATELGKVPKTKKNSKYNVLKVGLKWQEGILKKRVQKRLISRMKKGMLAEVKKLHQKGLSWKRLESFGLEYKFLAFYLQNKMSREEMLQKLETEIWHFAKRQNTWWKKDKEIKWFPPDKIAEVEKAISVFLKK